MPLKILNNNYLGHIPTSTVGTGGSVSNLSISESGGVFTASFNYSGVNSIPPDSSKSTATINIPTQLKEGEDVTFTLSNYFSPSGTAAGSHIYTLYAGASKANASQIYSGTTASYTLTSSEVGKYLVLEIMPVDVNGVQALEPVISNFTTNSVSSDSVIFQNAVHRYRWDSMLKSDASAAGVGEEAHTWLDIADGATDNLVWQGAGSPPNVSNGYVEIGTATDIEWFDNSITTIPQPYEVWYVMENLTGNSFNLFDQSSGQIQDNGANIRLNAGTQATFTGGHPTDNQQLVLRCVFDGINSEIFIDGVANGSNPQDAGAGSLTVIKIGSNGAGANWRCSEKIIFPENTDAYAADVLSELQTDYGL